MGKNSYLDSLVPLDPPSFSRSITIGSQDLVGSFFFLLEFSDDLCDSDLIESPKMTDPITTTKYMNSNLIKM